jgi:hypothetical protein
MSEAVVLLMAAVGIFLVAEVVMTGVLMVMQDTGALGPAALDWFSLAAPTWSGCLRMLSRAFPFLIGGISTSSKHTSSSVQGLAGLAGGPG